MGTTETFKDPLDVLIDDPGFRGVCITKLEKAMEKEITSNINNLKTILRDEEIKSN